MWNDDWPVAARRDLRTPFALTEDSRNKTKKKKAILLPD